MRREEEDRGDRSRDGLPEPKRNEPSQDPHRQKDREPPPASRLPEEVPSEDVRAHGGQELGPGKARADRDRHDVFHPGRVDPNEDDPVLEDLWVDAQGLSFLLGHEAPQERSRAPEWDGPLFSIKADEKPAILPQRDSKV